jgi:galactoside O-acetyltransferase
MKYLWIEHIFWKVVEKLLQRHRDWKTTMVKSNFATCGENIYIGENCFFWPPSGMHLGSNIDINSLTHVYAGGGIFIEDGVLIGANCLIATVSHPVDCLNRFESVTTSAPVRIKKNAWLGTGCIVLPGVTIGKNAVVGAGSVVVKDIPDDSVCVGNPAKVIRYLRLENDEFKGA